MRPPDSGLTPLSLLFARVRERIPPVCGLHVALPGHTVGPGEYQPLCSAVLAASPHFPAELSTPFSTSTSSGGLTKAIAG